MSVLFIVDSFKMADDDDALLVTHPKQVANIRARIHQHLLNPSTPPLKICVSHALFQRFKSFEGMQGVQVRYLCPTSQLANLLGEIPPRWLTDELIMSLHLLDCSPLPEEIREIEYGAGQVLGLLHSALLQPQSMSVFYQVLHELPATFISLLRLEPIQARLIQSLQPLIKLDCIQLLMPILLETTSIPNTLDALACEQVHEAMRRIVYEHPTILEFPIAPRQFDKNLLTCLPIITIAEADAQALPTQVIKLLEILARQIRANTYSEHILAELIVVAWPTVLARLTELVTDEPQLASRALIEALYALEDNQATILANKVAKYAHLIPCEPLPETATVETAKQWSWQYLDYARREFLCQQEPSEAISFSFTHWLINQQARIMRSDADWRKVSTLTTQYLATNHLVILCMVDALGALNMDMMTQELKQLDNLSFDEQVLFAPIPTLTEVAKMAILTGKNVTDLPSDSETALRQHYAQYLDSPSALKIAKSWREFKDNLETETKLFVCFENRIDERLHGCTSFDKHRKDIEIIAKQLARLIQDWLIDATQLQRELVVLITADHGVTSIAQKYAVSNDLGEVGERTIKVKQSLSAIAEPFEFLPQQNASGGYLVPKQRIRIGGNTPLTHGGLSPEEVLIPLLIITKGVPLNSETIITLKSEETYCPILNGEWQVNLILISHAIPVDKVKIVAKYPFTGEEGPMGPLRVYEKKWVRLKFTSAIEQAGQVQVPISILYYRSDTQETDNIETMLRLHLSTQMLEKDDKTRAFNEMFE